MNNSERYETLRRLYGAEDEQTYFLVVFGDHIAEREGYEDVGGIEAVHCYLAMKYHWQPSQLRTMSLEDLRFFLSEEMMGWTLPEAACV
jgi:hypothetical protein